MTLDFFKGVNNLNQGRTYERNYSSRDFNQGPSSPLSSPVNRSIQDRRDTNENVRVHPQQDHVNNGHGSWTNHNPMISIPEGLPRDHPHAYPYGQHHQDYRQQRYVIPNEQPRSAVHPTSSYNIPNGQFLQAPTFSYNEAPPRTSTHLHGCPSCASSIVVQVTADLSYHHVTLIPAPTARINQLAVKYGTQEYSPAPESIHRTQPDTDDHDDDDSLSNEMVTVLEKQPEMVTAHGEEVKRVLVETKEMRRSYASITAGKTMNDNKPSSEEENNQPSLEEEETNTNNDKPNSEDQEGKDNKTTNSQAEDAYDGNGFTTVVSSKTKKKVKAEAKAAAFAEVRRMFNKHRRGPQRDERGARGDRDKRGMGGSRDHGYDKQGRVAKDHGHDIHRGPPKEGHDKATKA